MYFGTDKMAGDLTKILNDPKSRRFLFNLLSECGIYCLSYDPKDASPTNLTFKEGKRSIGLNLVSQIMAVDPEKYIQMMKEGKE